MLILRGGGVIPELFYRGSREGWYVHELCYPAATDEFWMAFLNQPPPEGPPFGIREEAIKCPIRILLDRHGLPSPGRFINGVSNPRLFQNSTKSSCDRH